MVNWESGKGHKSILGPVHNAWSIPLDVAHIGIHMHTPLNVTQALQMIINTDVYLCVTLHHRSCLVFTWAMHVLKKHRILFVGSKGAKESNVSKTLQLNV